MLDDLERLLACLPPRVAAASKHVSRDIVEIVLDVGRPPVARLHRGYRYLDPEPVSREEVSAVIQATGATFLKNNRGGIDGTLHRVSVVRDRRGIFVGVTLRVGRHLTGVAQPLAPILLDTRDSIVFIGPPGSGKTTLLRDSARLLSETLGPAVLIVDSNNEIGGDGTVPHPAIGAARRMQVPDPDTPVPATQRDVMIEGVANQLPEVLIVDEIKTREEADAARTIARRGVRLIATVHGYTLADLVHNPDLCWLVGGVVPSSGLDGAGLRRAEPPTMAVAVEVRRDRTVAVIRNTAAAVDAVLAGGVAEPDEILSVPDPREEASRPPQPTRTDESIPETDPWGWEEPHED